ncbi:hypothetical protein CP533_3113 [Ophiocordyceps camponoti-saundersi (nom. inval.)]|nr:hypothetical protein CP533_3113 [Ophiocordyceps camponoti-saundersi (nom. inval.)]
MKSFSSKALVALASSALVYGQTYTACNPLQKKCDADPAFGHKVDCDFHQACPAFNTKGANIDYGAKGAVFTIKADGDSPTIHTGNYIFFGEVEIEVQAAPGRGIVTSVVLQSDDLDEIDWEWIGSKNTQVQSNYFSKGNTDTYDRGATHTVANPTGQFHTYKIKWTPSSIVWSINGEVARTLTYESAKGGSAFPQTPMQVKIGTWVAGGAKSSPGTVEWAGGKTDFKEGPFLAYYRRISITDFAGKDTPANGGVKEYVYKDHSGTFKSIDVKMGHSTEDSKHAENGLGDGHDNGSSSHNENKSAVEENMVTTTASSSHSSSTSGPESDSSSNSSSSSSSSSTTMVTVGSGSNATTTLSSPRKSGPTSTSGSGSQSTSIPGSGSTTLPAAALSLVMAIFAAQVLLL